MPSGRLESINISNGGVPKTGVFEGLITEQGVSGDVQSDLRHHGGPDRAVVLFSLELIRALQHEGHPIATGTTGENLTVSGIEWTLLTPGTQVQVGTVRLRITSYAAPCSKIAASFADHDVQRIWQTHYPGWSRLCARVVVGGLVRPGDGVEIA
jgi:MOSC domain-containing protein YiiM